MKRRNLSFASTTDTRRGVSVRNADRRSIADIAVRIASSTVTPSPLTEPLVGQVSFWTRPIRS